VELIWSFGICIRWINNIQVIKFILHRFCCLLITNLLSFFLNRGVKSNKLLVKTCCLLEASTIWHDLYYTPTLWRMISRFLASSVTWNWKSLPIRGTWYHSTFFYFYEFVLTDVLLWYLFSTLYFTVCLSISFVCFI
jgi:hypothetical protein